MRIVKLIAVGIFMRHIAFSQRVYSTKVIPLDSSLTVNQQLLTYVQKYNFILVGEMHGTQEPVKFVTQLAKALSRNKKVIVGFEIAQDEINLKPSKISAKKLKHSPAFKNSVDGKNSQAWFNAIIELTRTKGVHVFFFDNTKDQEDLLRDSAMFLNIKQQFLKDTSAVVITISGNIHNQQAIREGKKPMGYFLSTHLSNRVLSVNHVYSYGSMFNRTTEGLTLRTLANEPNVLTTVSKSANYFYPDPDLEFSLHWNSFLFTTKINAAFPIKNE